MCVKLARVALNVCECAREEEGHPGRWAALYSCLAKVL